MALSIKELQIGDWVTFGDEPLKVQHIYNNGYDDVVAETMEEFLDEDGVICEEIKDVPLVNCSPIPLTPEILENNRFIKVNSQRYDYGYPDTDCYVKVNPKKNMIHVNGRNANSNLYSHSFVHELQRALRLCGLNELADNFKV